MHAKKSRPTSPTSPARLLLVMAIFAVLGGYFLLATRAAGPSTNLEPEDGSRSNVQIITDATASQQKAISFSSPSTPGGGGLPNMPLYVIPNSRPAQQANEWRNSRPADAALMDKLASQQLPLWINNHNEVSSLTPFLSAAKAKGALPVAVIYNIPKKNCSTYAGASPNAQAYRAMIDDIAKTIGSYHALVALEPDSVPQTRDCLNEQERQTRYSLLKYAIGKLQALPNVYVYLDGGSNGWVNDTTDMANRLRNAGVEQADGFSLNISSFETTTDTMAYGRSISSKIGGKHFVIDTARNGLGPYENTANPGFGGWCNPPGRALGHYPTVRTGQDKVDAFLYLKTPGRSDGDDPDYTKCHGGPSAGTWWPDYALGLIKRWPTHLQPPK